MRRNLSASEEAGRRESLAQETDRERLAVVEFWRRTAAESHRPSADADGCLRKKAK